MQQLQEFLFLSSLKDLNKLIKYRASAVHKLNLILLILLLLLSVVRVQEVPFSGPWRCFVPQDHLDRSLWPRSPGSQSVGVEGKEEMLLNQA